MAHEEMNPSSQNIMENPRPEPFVWTEDAHSLYLTFLEEAFVNDLYHRHYCSLDICGCSPPFSSTPSAHTAAAESPSTAPPQCPSAVVLSNSEPEARAETKTRRRGFRASTKTRCSSKRKGKWPSQEAGLENEQVFDPTVGLQDAKSVLEQPGSSSHSDRVVPKVSHGVSKRSRLKAKMDGIERLGIDQVVPIDAR